MNEKTIVLVKKNGKLEIKTQGYKGRKCIQDTKDLEEYLGKTTYFEKTTEFYEDGEKEKIKLTNW